MAKDIETTEQSSCLSLLNAISLGESAAGVYLEAWADVTPHEDLACALRLVAARERSHGEVFCRRISELGYTLCRKPDRQAAERLATLSDPRISDLEKIACLDPKEADPFVEIRRRMAEGEFDSMTNSLMNWYLDEEKDSLRRLRAVFDCVREADAGRSSGGARTPAVGGPSADAEAVMICMTAGFARMEKAIEKLAKASR
jgi:hypothetical protein